MKTNVDELDIWINNIVEIYEQNNGERDFKDVLIFFNEDIGRCFQLINRRREKEIEFILPSMFRWFCVLHAKSGHKNVLVSDILWNKFPKICPYCQESRCQCNIVKKNLDFIYLSDQAEASRKNKPKTINEWQQIFQKIYPRGEETNLMMNVSHLSEELAELSEVHRLEYTKKEVQCVEMELADVFSWIMGLANLINQLKKIENPRGSYNLGDIIKEQYSDGCPECKEVRNKFPENKCCCSVKPQKLRLVSDYENLGDMELESYQHRI